MNEETTNVEMMDDDLGFDDSDFGDLEDTGDHTEDLDTEAAEEPASDPPETSAEPTETAEQPADQQELFELNYMGNVEKHTREEMIALAQKGKDRDRILQQRDAAQQFRTQNEPLISDLGRIAQKFGMNSPADLLMAMETNLLRQQGKTQDEADAIIRADRADRQLKAVQSQEQRAREQQETARRRQEQDVRNFLQKYPNVDTKTIPASVWQEVRKGELLVDAYGRYEMEQLRAENQRLQQQLGAKAQNDKNRENTIGSMRSGSQTQKKDVFLDALFAD